MASSWHGHSDADIMGTSTPAPDTASVAQKKSANTQSSISSAISSVAGAASTIKDGLAAKKTLKG